MANNINISLVLKSKNFINKMADVKRRLSTLEQTSQTIGRTMQYALGGALIAVAADAGKAAAEFDLINRKLKALAGGEGDVGALADTARRLGEESVFTAAEVADVQLQMKKLGLTVKDVDATTEGVIRFATAMDTDVALAGATLVKNLNRFGGTFDKFASKADATTAISEQFAFATLNSALNFDTLGSALGYVGGEANAAGFSFAETTAILAKLADAGFEGSRAGTILRRILINLAKDGVVDLKDGFGDLIENQQEFAELIKITGARSAGGIASIQGLRDAVDQFAKDTEDASGGIDSLFDAVDQSLIGRLKNLRSAIQEVGIKFLDAFGTPLIGAISSLADWIRSIDEGDVALARMVGSILLVSKALSGLKAAGLIAAGAIKDVGRILASFNPAGVIVAGFAAGLGIVLDQLAKTASLSRKAEEAVDRLAETISGFSDNKIETQIEEKSFKDFDDFSQQVGDYIAQLTDLRAEASTDLQKRFGNQKLDSIRNALNAGISVAELIKKYEERTEAGRNTFGLSNDEYRNLVNAVFYQEQLNKKISDLNQLLLRGSTGEESFWSNFDPEYDINELLTGLSATKIGGVGVIEAFESVNGVLGKFKQKSTGLFEAASISAYGDRVDELKDKLKKLEDQQDRNVGTAQEDDEVLEARIDDTKLLISYYERQKKAMEDANEELAKFGGEDFVGGETGLLQSLNNFTLTGVSEEFKELSKDFNKLLEYFPRLNDAFNKFRDLGFTNIESLKLTLQGFQAALGAIERVATSVGETFAEALVDPTRSLAQAFGDALREFLKLAIAWVAKIALMTGLIAAGNAITGGGLSAFLKATSASQSVGTNLSNNIASNGLGNLFSGFRSTVSGNDLVVASGRGYNINSRVYG